MFLQKLKRITPDKYLFLILVSVLIFFYSIFKGQIPFPGDLLVNFYEPYKAYSVLGYVPGSVPTKNQGADVVRHMFPWKNFTVNSLKAGEIPFWNPHNFSGNPLMANFQSAVFYPLNIVFFIMPFLSAWTLYIIIAPILAAFFMFFFLREIKLSSLASLFGGLVFAFSSYSVVWMEYGNIGHAFLWLPLGLFFTEKIIKGGSLRNNVYLILVLLMSILAGYIQGSFYVVSVIFIYFVAKSFLSKSLSLKRLIIFSVTLVFPILLSFFQVLPMLELFKGSTRSNYTLEQIKNLLNPWWYGVTVVVPNFFGNPASNNHWFYGTYIERVSYIGLIPFTLFVYALLNFRKRKESLIFGVVGLVTFFVSIDLFITKHFFTIPIPVISTTVPTRILSIYQFCAVVLSAIGLDQLKERYNKRALIISCAFVGVLLVASWVFAYFGSTLLNIDSGNLSTVKRNLVIPTALISSFSILSYLYFKKFKLVLILIFALTLFELFYFFHRITPFSPKEFVYPQTPIISFLQKNASINRFWGYGSGYVESNFQTYDKTYSPEGVDPIHIKRYTRLIEAGKNGKIVEELPRPDANLAPGYGSTDLRQNKYRQKLLDLLGVKFILNKSESEVADYGTFPDNIYKLIYHDGSYQIYENKEVLPRAFLASEYIVLTDMQKIVDKIFDSSFDLKKTLILEEDPKMKFAQDKDSSVKIDRYANNNVLMSTSSKTNMLLFLSDTHSSEWKARVDGKEAELYRADYAFRAVSVPTGNHSVESYYWGESFYNGLKISLISFLVLIVSYLVLRKYEKKK